MSTTAEPSSALLDRVRKLLAKAEAEGVTPPEAEALTGKAAELMAKYGIDRARLGALNPGTDVPDDQVIDIDNPWAGVKAHLLCGIAGAMRCQCIMLNGRKDGRRVHLFGYTSDLERSNILYTSLLLQMASGLAHTPIPVRVSSVKAWRRSWMLGFTAAVTVRVRAAEEHATATATAEDAASGTTTSTTLVLADRSLVIKRQLEEFYPVTRQTRVTYTGRGYQDGYAKGQAANIGGTGIGSHKRALTG